MHNFKCLKIERTFENVCVFHHASDVRVCVYIAHPLLCTQIVQIVHSTLENQWLAQSMFSIHIIIRAFLFVSIYRFKWHKCKSHHLYGQFARSVRFCIRVFPLVRCNLVCIIYRCRYTLFMAYIFIGNYYYVCTYFLLHRTTHFSCIGTSTAIYTIQTKATKSNNHRNHKRHSE